MKSKKFVSESWNIEDHQLLGHVVGHINEYYIKGVENEITYEEMEEYWKEGWEGTPNKIRKLLMKYYSDPEIWIYDD